MKVFNNIKTNHKNKGTLLKTKYQMLNFEIPWHQNETS